MFQIKQKSVEQNTLSVLQRRARSRVLRRMQELGPRHRLTIQATYLSMLITEMVERGR